MSQILRLVILRSDEGVLDVEVPMLAPILTPGTPYDWNYTTVAQAGYNNRVVPYPRGKILGGSTSVSMSLPLSSEI